MKPIHVVSFQYRPQPNATVVNTTSRSTNWSRGLSPFFLGPVPLYRGMMAQNVENAWQYTKCYAKHCDDNGDPTDAYFEWAKAGFAKQSADRYPMGRGAKPEFSYWAGKKLPYIEARKRIYMPLYHNAVKNTTAYSILKRTYEECESLYLVDFDAHNICMSDFDPAIIVNNDKIKMGHGYILAMMLMELDIDAL